MKPGDIITPANDEITVTTLGQGTGKRHVSYSHHWTRGALLTLLRPTSFRLGEDITNTMEGWLVKEPCGDIGFLPHDCAQLCEVVVVA